jgi:hypothetical protein
MTIIRRTGAACVPVLILALSLASPLGGVARAELVPSSNALAAPDAGAQARAHVAAWIARADVAEQLERMGLPPGEAAQRVAALSDAEAQALSERIDSLPAGAGWGFVLVVIVVVFAILIITDAVGLTDIFPWVRNVR